MTIKISSRQKFWRYLLTVSEFSRARPSQIGVQNIAPQFRSYVSVVNELKSLPYMLRDILIFSVSLQLKCITSIRYLSCQGISRHVKVCVASKYKVVQAYYTQSNWTSIRIVLQNILQIVSQRVVVHSTLGLADLCQITIHYLPISFGTRKILIKIR